MADEVRLSEAPHGWIRLELSPKQLDHLKLLCRFHIAESKNERAVALTQRLAWCLSRWPRDVSDASGVAPTDRPYAVGDDIAAIRAARIAGVAPVEAPKLAVWFGAMPESNGKANWTAILHRGDLASGHTIYRSEHHDRTRYHADCVRWLIGELPDEPDILAYDEAMLWPGGWTHPCGAALPVAVQPKNDDDALLIDNLFRATLTGDSMAIDTARMALRRRMNELRTPGVPASEGGQKP